MWKRKIIYKIWFIGDEDTCRDCAVHDTCSTVKLSCWTEKPNMHSLWIKEYWGTSVISKMSSSISSSMIEMYLFKRSRLGGIKLFIQTLLIKYTFVVIKNLRERKWKNCTFKLTKKVVKKYNLRNNFKATKLRQQECYKKREKWETLYNHILKN